MRGLAPEHIFVYLIKPLTGHYSFNRLFTCAKAQGSFAGIAEYRSAAFQLFDVGSGREAEAGFKHKAGRRVSNDVYNEQNGGGYYRDSGEKYEGSLRVIGE